MPATPKDRSSAVRDLEPVRAAAVPCCPELTREPCCDRLTFNYRLRHRVRDVTVEVTIEAELERCPGPLSLGDLVYSTTLLPGETVRLFTSSRKNRFTFDAESQVSYRHEQASEESFYMSSMSKFMSDLSVGERIDQDRTSSGSFRTEGSVSGALESIFGSPSVTVSGSHNASSTLDFTRELMSHAEGSSSRSVEATRAASSVAVGEVQSRSHAEGESESTFEAATRTISNPNRCHAVTYFAYQIDKRQIVRFRIKAIRRRVVDPAGDSGVTLNPPTFTGDVAIIPQGVLATNPNRVEVEAVGRASGLADRAGVVAGGGESVTGAGQLFQGRLLTARDFRVEQAARPAAPLTAEARAEALQQVDEELVAAGLLDRAGGQLSDEMARELSFEIQTCLPTPALLIKGCLDDCNVCEPARERQIELELERAELENRLLERQIELLDRAQQYRCCPAGEEEDEDGEDA